MEKHSRHIHLEFLRGTAAILVLLHHVRVMIFPFFDEFPAELQTPLVRGYIFLSGFNRPSVLVFFTLSGYLIIGKIVRSLPLWSWRSYLIDRLSRLWAVLIPSLILTCIFITIGRYCWGSYAGGIGYIISPDNIDISPLTFLGNLLFLQTLWVPTLGDNGPLWSLAYEFWYYLLFPLVFVGIVKERFRWFHFILAAGVLILLWHANRDILFLFPCWLAGGLASYVEKHPFWGRLKAYPWLLPIGFAQLAVTLVIHRTIRSDNLITDYLLALSVALFSRS